mmetsp:Transcript_27316/g.67509  ORF Transcript_27316/g.67509 Transcript_27316/m.67509 type:complete len:204 (-) Transcript_27316:394-1005(-)
MAASSHDPAEACAGCVDRKRFHRRGACSNCGSRVAAWRTAGAVGCPGARSGSDERKLLRSRPKVLLIASTTGLDPRLVVSRGPSSRATSCKRGFEGAHLSSIGDVGAEWTGAPKSLQGVDGADRICESKVSSLGSTFCGVPFGAYRMSARESVAVPAGDAVRSVCASWMTSPSIGAAMLVCSSRTLDIKTTSVLRRGSSSSQV